MVSDSHQYEGVVVDDSVLSVAPIMRFCVCSMFRCALLCILFIFVSILIGKTELDALLFASLVSCDCYCKVALPHSAVGWSAVVHYSISWSYFLAFFVPKNESF